MGNPNNRTGPAYGSTFTKHRKEIKSQYKNEVEEQGRQYGMAPLPPPQRQPMPRARQLAALKTSAPRQAAQARPLPPAAAAFPFSKLFSLDPQRNTEYKKIRNIIYYHYWSRDRRERSHADLVITEKGIEHNIIREDQIPIERAGLSSSVKSVRWQKAHSYGLLFASRLINRDFTRYVYSHSSVEIEVQMRPFDTELNRALIRSLLSTLRGTSNLARFVRHANVAVHFPDPKRFPPRNLPEMNEDLLHSINDVMDGWSFDKKEKTGKASLRVQVIFGATEPTAEELAYAALPFYDMTFTGWRLYGIFGTQHLEYRGGNLKWLDKAHQQILARSKQSRASAEELTHTRASHLEEYDLTSVSRCGALAKTQTSFCKALKSGHGLPLRYSHDHSYPRTARVNKLGRGREKKEENTTKSNRSEGLKSQSRPTSPNPSNQIASSLAGGPTSNAYANLLTGSVPEYPSRGPSNVAPGPLSQPISRERWIGFGDFEPSCVPSRVHRRFSIPSRDGGAPKLGQAPTMRLVSDSVKHANVDNETIISKI